MRVRALMFASLRDVVGGRSVEMELPEGSTVEDLSRALIARHPLLADRLPRVRVAVNDAMAELSRVLCEGDEVAYLPPVSGGGPDLVEVVEAPIDVAAVLGSVQSNDCGAVMLFLGTVRDNFRGLPVLGMEYEAHRALAEHGLSEVVAEARRRWPAVRAASVVHRIGRMDLGETSVAVAVAAPHRPEAFEAGRFVIDRLKETVPIWKRELLTDGEVWIEGDERIPRGCGNAHGAAHPVHQKEVSAT